MTVKTPDSPAASPKTGETENQFEDKIKKLEAELATAKKQNESLTVALQRYATALNTIQSTIQLAAQPGQSNP